MDTKEFTITLRIPDYSGSHAYAMDIVNECLGTVCIIAEFEKAELDGNLLLSKDGDAPNNVKELGQYTNIMRKLSITK